MAAGVTEWTLVQDEEGNWCDPADAGYVKRSDGLWYPPWD